MGSSDSEATHALILDRENLAIYIAPVKEAEAFLREQWPPEPPLRTSQSEYLAQISEALKQVKQPEEMDIGGFCISPRKGIFPRARVDLSWGRMELLPLNVLGVWPKPSWPGKCIERSPF